ncbi:MAG TPA: hypothetical protein VN045_09505 [Microbacteriaceae bacterium]|jgi:hypothetical protein|nr:hypothetical protein [Microbacteriaceae bacterium]
MTFASDLRDEQSALALQRLGYGLTVSATAVILISLVAFITGAEQYPHVGLCIVAWVLLACTAIFVLTRRFAFAESPQGFVAVLVVSAVVVALDIVGSWTGTIESPHPSAATAVGGILLACVNTRPMRDIVISTTVLSAALVLTFVTSLHGDVLALGPRIVVVLLAAVPPMIGVQVVRSFRSLVQIESDRTQVQATVSTAGITVGMLASKELARLDLDAEQLLDAVATGHAPLPLSPKTASQAASIATELRLHLIAGRGRTWLYHAVSESAVLGPVVTVTDPDGLAAQLSTDQRDALLSAVWLFAADLSRATQKLRIDLRQPKKDGESDRRIFIQIEASGVPRKQVDPAVWQAIGKVGAHTESHQDDVLLVDIDCDVERSTGAT